MSDYVAISALVIAVVAFVTTVVQLAQTIIATARGLPNCDERVMGKWAKYTSRKFKWWQLRLEIDFEAPVIFLAPNDNENGPVKGSVLIWYADGSNSSCEDYRVAVPAPQGQDDEDVFNQGLGRERVHTIDNELATWVKLLMAIQKMERASIDWERKRNRQAKFNPGPTGVITLAVGLQAKKRSFDANPTVKKPYATTTMCHIVELAAVLGLYWKEFNRDQNKYRAEGNGYSLLGTRLDDFGLVFVFEKCGWPNFEETRIIPTSEVKELCFGNAPTFYRNRDRKEDERWNTPLSEQKTFQTLQLGSRHEIAETLNLIGCNKNTTLYFTKEMKHSHLFSVTFEILGMLGRTLHIRDRCFTYLPNPTIFAWNPQSFSLRRMLDEFHKHLSRDIRVIQLEGHLTAELDQINALASQLSEGLPREDSGFMPQDLNQLHDAIDQVDGMIAANKIDKKVVLDVLRRHLQEVLLAVNTTEEQLLGKAPLDTPSAKAEISFDGLLTVPPENREREFMKMYFSEIRHRVISTDSKDHHDPQAADASLSIHKDDQQQKQQEQKQKQQEQKQQQEQEQRQQEQQTQQKSSSQQSAQQQHMQQQEAATQGECNETTQAQAQTETQTRCATPPGPPPIATTMSAGPGSRMSTFTLPKRGNTWSNSLGNVFEMRRNNIWCALVFRMLCWLLLHDFDKNDVQVSKSELMGSRLPVYIM